MAPLGNVHSTGPFGTVLQRIESYGTPYGTFVIVAQMAKQTECPLLELYTRI